MKDHEAEVAGMETVLTTMPSDLAAFIRIMVVQPYRQWWLAEQERRKGLG